MWPPNALDFVNEGPIPCTRNNNNNIGTHLPHLDRVWQMKINNRNFTSHAHKILEETDQPNEWYCVDNVFIDFNLLR